VIVNPPFSKTRDPETRPRDPDEGVFLRRPSNAKPASGSFVMLASFIWIDESKDLAGGFLEHIRRQAANAPRLSHAPVKALDLI
jgi:hypothetical protein